MATAELSLGKWLTTTLCVIFFGIVATPSQAQDTSVQQALMQAVASEPDLDAFYRTTGYEPLWTGKEFRYRQRVRTLITAMARAGDHGLPTARHDPSALRRQARDARGPLDQAKLEVAYSKAFLAYANDLKTGFLDPNRIIDDIQRKRQRYDQASFLRAFAAASPDAYFASLAPQTPEYANLMAEKQRLERRIAQGWGPKVPRRMEPGQQGDPIKVLRTRLTSLGYDVRSDSALFDDDLKQVVMAFQRDHGLQDDGIVGHATVTELNKHPVDRLASVLVAMERERWMNFELGARHVWANIPDFTAKIIDDGRVTFETRTVVGKDALDHRSPEFSDRMDYIVVNPTWNVPRTIAVKEYLPMMKADPNAASHLQLLDRNEQLVSRSAVNFSAYTEDNFPFRLKEPPSRGNALGTVKFMFPNRYNIYMHDTPHKSLFSRDLRAYSHGCIRLRDPHDFAYTVLAAQTANPQNMFQSTLATSQETTVDLVQPIQVHIVYRTAFSKPGGRMQYRRDVYGRDRVIFDAMQAAGVSMRVIRS